MGYNEIRRVSTGSSTPLWVKQLDKEFPLISIITPSLNQGAYIEGNIKSVMSQHYPHFEHIIIDGGSTDGTIDILRKYKHLIWVSERDSGQSAAINKGFKRANGEIIGWLNSDDCYEPNAFNTVAQELNRTECRYIVFSDSYVIDAKGNLLGLCKAELPYPNNLIKYWEENYTIPQPTVFFYKDIFQKVGYLDENLHYVMDYDFWIRISKYYQLHYIKKPLARMRIHDRSKSSSGYEVFEREWFRVSKKYWGGLLSVNYYRHLSLALDFRSELMRISAYSKMEEISLKEFRRKIFISIVSNPLNLFKRRLFSAFLRSILGHQSIKGIKKFFG